MNPLDKSAPKRLVWRRRTVWLLALVVVGLSCIWVISGQLVQPANQAVGDPPDDLPLKTVVVASESGSQLAVWYSQQDSATATIVLAHPLGGNRLSMVDRARLMIDEGYDVVLVDLQAHGESSGDQITAGHLESLDVLATLRFARDQYGVRSVGVIGCSLGGVATALARPSDVDALVLEAVYPTIDDAVRNRVAMRVGPLATLLTPLLLWQIPIRLGVELDELRPIDAVRECDRPMLFLAGENDQRTTLAESERLVKAAGDDASLVVFDGAGHDDLLKHNRQLYEQSVLPFFRDAFLRAGDQESR